ncbi:hypothetical protein BC829DRAFT_406289 [Chytridium lagenaria]|nr:hypothetical protein BC829DRAFT_406289 [Chytridium lagenaria]
MIFGWMNGKMQYAWGLMILTVDVWLSRFFFWGPSFNKVIPYLKGLSVLRGGENSVIVHAFSNGGTVNLRHLTESLKRANTNLQTSAIILDSTPGRGEPEAAISAFTYGMKGVTGFLAKAGFRGFFFLWGLLTKVTGQRDTPVERAARNVISSKTGPLKGPRLYLYSKIDPLVNYRHVEEHVEMTRRDGMLFIQSAFIRMSIGGEVEKVISTGL